MEVRDICIIGKLHFEIKVLRLSIAFITVTRNLEIRFSDGVLELLN